MSEFCQVFISRFCDPSKEGFTAETYKKAKSGKKASIFAWSPIGKRHF